MFLRANFASDLNDENLTPVKSLNSGKTRTKKICKMDDDIFAPQAQILKNCSNDVRQMKFVLKSMKNKLESSREEHLDKLLTAKIQVANLMENLIKSRDRYEDSYRNLTASMAAISENMGEYCAMFKNFESDAQDELNEKNVEFNKVEKRLADTEKRLMDTEKRLSDANEKFNKQRSEMENLKNENKILKDSKNASTPPKRDSYDEKSNSCRKFAKYDAAANANAAESVSTTVKDLKARLVQSTVVNDELRENLTRVKDVNNELREKLAQATIANDELNEKFNEQQDSLNYFETVANQKLVEAEELQQKVNEKDDQIVELMRQLQLAQEKNEKIRAFLQQKNP